ncbi:hypothetical protein GCM10023194_40990 [Planotetraspora phitsanulokensis]|uniref:DUF305 domain-containing protein n=1 Tax=Planotetraspora phitsanulokensis TaxID=575192 RepID=A0A8J3U941_9ACTN|nr:DUF305 domain-containing protein [Planotetraspora phitsanulokensis]GII40913.1 hypothetical protein Pph01_59160 [Planotetraspora phitsanulokensis]
MLGSRAACGAFITLALTSGAVLTGCSPADQPTPLVVGSQVPVVVPGGPGEPGRTAQPGERIGQSEARAAAADVRFAEMMIPHHRQALEMAALAPDRAAEPLVRAIAQRIESGQGPEIAVMTSWLETLGRAAPDGHDHGEAGYGMATLEEMNRLRAARGAAFDDLFLRLMIRHHGGAITMAGEELGKGQDRAMRKMAQDVMSGQQIEIARMRKIQAA